jgi:archaellum component FlaC
MRAIFVDLDNDIKEIAAEVEMLSLALDTHIATKQNLAPHMSWLAIGGLASGVEKVYSGCERVMAAIASKIDDSPVPHDGGWHATLLRRMHNEFPGVRNQVISDETYRALDGMRAFRHRERNTYGITLDSEIVGERVSEAIQAFEMFREDIKRLADSPGPTATDSPEKKPKP